MIHVRYNKGSALATVLIAMFVTVTLGTTLLGVSVFADKQSHLEYGRMQAYQLARSGAEAGLAALSEELGKETVALPSGTATMYLDGSMNLVSTVPSVIKGRFDVTIGTSGGEYVVTSIGNASGSTQTVTASVQVNSREVIDVSGDDTLASMSGIWYDENGHAKQDDGSSSYHPTTPVKIDNIKQLKIVHDNIEFDAPMIVFQGCYVHNLTYNLGITANVVVFEESFTINNKKGSITLKEYDGGYTRSGKAGTFGIVQYQSQWFWFPHNKLIENTEEFLSLDPVEDTSVIDSIVGSTTTTKTIKDLSVKWGRG